MTRVVTSLLLVALLAPLPACSLARVGNDLIAARAEHLGFTEHHLAKDGWYLRYWVGGEGPPLLLLHGFGGDGLTTWRPQLDALARVRRVIVPDLLWFGESGGVDAQPGLDTEARAQLALLAAEGVARTDVMGVSYGGFVLLKMQALNPDVFDRRVIVDSPGPAFSEEEQAEMLARFGASSPADIFLADTPEQVQALIDLTRVHHRRLPRFLLRDLQRNVFAAHRAEQAALLTDLPTHRADGLTAVAGRPPLVVWGSDDPVFPVASGRRLADMLGADIVVIPETAHAPMTEKPAEFNQIVLDYLGR
jgi:pimeloyl-ACP methyl ester carboxylesterase